MIFKTCHTQAPLPVIGLQYSAPLCETINYNCVLDSVNIYQTAHEPQNNLGGRTELFKRLHSLICGPDALHHMECLSECCRDKHR